MDSSDEDDTFSAEGGDDDVSLPRATVFKLIKEMMPKDIRCANETRELILECCTEFIHLIASEANEVCEKDGRKTIAPEHVLTSLKNLGFDSYMSDTQAVLEEHKTEKQRRVEKGKKKITISPEELAAQQRELFAQARMRSNSQTGLPRVDAGSATATPPLATAAPTAEASEEVPAPAQPALARREQNYTADDDYDD